jgi:hypothetical protein
MKNDTSGGHANYTGSTLEKFIHDRLIERNYQYIPREKFKVSVYLGQPIYTRQFHIGNSIYETPMYCDFILYHPKKWTPPSKIMAVWEAVIGFIQWYNSNNTNQINSK